MWLGLLLLAAFFTMHGPQCMAAPSTAGHTMAGTPEVGAALTGPLGAPVLASALSVHVASATSSWSALPPAIHGQPVDSARVDLASACVIVLLVALGLLGAAVLLSATPWRPSRGARLHVRSPGWVRPPRPPDLFSLCLLRT